MLDSAIRPLMARISRNGLSRLRVRGLPRWRCHDVAHRREAGAHYQPIRFVRENQKDVFRMDRDYFYLQLGPRYVGCG